MDIIFLTDYAEKAGCANKAISQNGVSKKGRPKRNGLV
jgi:hypothetical protein